MFKKLFEDTGVKMAVVHLIYAVGKALESSLKEMKKDDPGS